jgi:hypothetical protein
MTSVKRQSLRAPLHPLKGLYVVYGCGGSTTYRYTSTTVVSITYGTYTVLLVVLNSCSLLLFSEYMKGVEYGRTVVVKVECAIAQKHKSTGAQ